MMYMRRTKARKIRVATPPPDHGAGIVEAVEEHRHQVAEGQIPGLAGRVAVDFAELGPAVEYPHEHGKAQVAGDRGDRPEGGGGQAVAEHILDVFKGGKARETKTA